MRRRLIAPQRRIDQNFGDIASGRFDVALEPGPAWESGLARDDEVRLAERESRGKDLLVRNVRRLREVPGDADRGFGASFAMSAQKVFGALALLFEIED